MEVAAMDDALTYRTGRPETDALLDRSDACAAASRAQMDRMRAMEPARESERERIVAAERVVRETWRATQRRTRAAKGRLTRAWNTGKMEAIDLAEIRLQQAEVRERDAFASYEDASDIFLAQMGRLTEEGLTELGVMLDRSRESDEAGRQARQALYGM
jgi:predicted nucleic acid-binding protein